MNSFKTALAAGLFAVVASVASASTVINLYNDDTTASSGGTDGIRGTVTCLQACDALVYIPGIFEYSDGSAGTGTNFAWDGAKGEVFYNSGNSGGSTQLDDANKLLAFEGITYTSLFEDVDSASSGIYYKTNGDYVFLKIGNTPEIAVIRNLSGGTLSFSFSKADGAKGGLSNWFSVCDNPNNDPNVCDDPDGGPDPVPLPAAGWLLIGGVGILTAMKRRQKAA